MSEEASMAKVKVRIAVVVAANGQWSAQGWSTGRLSQMDIDRRMISNCYECLPGEYDLAAAEYFVEVELGVPEAKVVEGAVVEKWEVRSE